MCEYSVEIEFDQSLWTMKSSKAPVRARSFRQGEEIHASQSGGKPGVPR